MLSCCVVEKYFEDLSRIIVNLDFQEKPEKIWNCDETGKQLSLPDVAASLLLAALAMTGQISQSWPALIPMGIPWPLPLC